MARDVVLPPVRAKRCETCLNYDPDQRTCRALYPVAVPIPAPGGAVGAVGIFPPMPPDGWCAKWESLPLS